MSHSVYNVDITDHNIADLSLILVIIYIWILFMISDILINDN